MKLGLIFLGIATILFFFVYAGVRDEVKVTFPIEPRGPSVWVEPTPLPLDTGVSVLPKPSNAVPSPYKSQVCYQLMSGEVCK